ncbi:MAG: ribonuclease H family protein [bacterium]|nr:ribonuclease H family protein [bacterium]
MKKKYYAYVVPARRARGVTGSWTECEKIVSGVSGARYRAFKAEAEARAWLAEGAVYAEQKISGALAARKTKKPLESGIYFDAGTGRGRGVEISVTDEKGNNLLHRVLPRALINEFGKHRLGKEATNNYGELLAMKYALKLALKERVKRIFGDSKLVIDYWSKGHIREKKVAPETVLLAGEVSNLREKFKAAGGRVARVPGSVNPADLGFH